MFAAGRPWPLAFGAGVGIGMGFSNCQHDFMYPDLHHGHLKKVTFYCDWFIDNCVSADWWKLNNNNNNVTVPDTYADSHLADTATTARAAADKAAGNKEANSHIFVPVAIESAGTWNHQAVELVYRSWADEWQPSLKTPGRQLTCSSGCQWLYSGVMRSPSTALSPPTKRRCGLLA